MGSPGGSGFPARRRRSERRPDHHGDRGDGLDAAGGVAVQLRRSVVETTDPSTLIRRRPSVRSASTLFASGAIFAIGLPSSKTRVFSTASFRAPKLTIAVSPWLEMDADPSNDALTSRASTI